VALYLAQHAGRRYDALFSDEADGALDPERKRMFMAMKREVLRVGGYQREFFVSQTPELTAMADAVIDLDAMRDRGVTVDGAKNGRRPEGATPCGGQRGSVSSKIGSPSTMAASLSNLSQTMPANLAASKIVAISLSAGTV